MNGDTLTLTHDSDHWWLLSHSRVIHCVSSAVGMASSSVDYATAHDALVLTEQDTRPLTNG